MIKEALKRAVLHGTSNFAYIDKIFLRWQKNGIKTIEQLETETNQVNEKKAPQNIMTNDTDYNDIYKI